MRDEGEIGDGRANAAAGATRKSATRCKPNLKTMISPGCDGHVSLAFFGAFVTRALRAVAVRDLSSGGAGPHTCSSGSGPSSGSSSALSAGSSVGWRNAVACRQLAVEQARRLQLVETRQVADRVESELDQEFGRRAVGDRPARRLAPPAHAHPARLHQHVERALRDRDAADLLDVGARHRLMIGDDRERLERGARQLALFFPLARQQPGEIFGGPKRPAPGDPHEIDAAAGVELRAIPP